MEPTPRRYPDFIVTDVLGQRIQVGHTVLYAGYCSNRLRQATVIALRQREGRPELLVKLHNDRGSVSVLHHPGRTYVLRAHLQGVRIEAEYAEGRN